ncbi:MAG: S1 RNA-binding domain-containing protein, partial [Minisyncoccales bacterium]
MVKKNKEELKEGDVVLGKVDKISGETVFVDIGKGKKGTIVTSEVAPGRIRNLRDYVSPNKKIVCKVLEKGENNIHLSLRRVTEKEKDKVMKEHERRKSCKKILQTVLEKNEENIIKEIEKNEGNLYQFLQDSKEDSKKLEKYIDKDKAKKVIEILKKRKGKQVKIHSKIKLTTIQEKGLDKIKEIL